MATQPAMTHQSQRIERLHFVKKNYRTHYSWRSQNSDALRWHVIWRRKQQKSRFHDNTLTNRNLHHLKEKRRRVKKYYSAIYGAKVGRLRLKSSASTT